MQFSEFTVGPRQGSFRVGYQLARADGLVGRVGELRLEPAPRAGARLAVGA